MIRPHKNAFSARLSALTFLALSLTAPAQAQTGGKLLFLGWTADLQHSVWLSAVLPGVYDLRSAQYGTHFDDWTQTRRGLHLTVSPEVSEWGGTHNLFVHITDPYSSYQNWVASDDQQPGRFTFPNTFTPPVRPPEPTQPTDPDTLTPTAPGGVMPPIGHLPPAGVTPSVPSAVTPPIGMLPPTGLTPAVPGGVRPPIATLPEGTRPPVATLPPGGLTPTIPGGTVPPVAVLPEGVRPPMFQRPETLPPVGLTPAVPATPAIPTRRAGPPGVVVAQRSPGGEASRRTLDESLRACVPAARLAPLADGSMPLPTQLQNDANCPPTPVSSTSSASPATTPAPSPAQRWNVWTDLMTLGLKDHRFDADMTGRSTSFTIGSDTRLDNGLIVGLTTGWQNSHTSSFDGAMRLDSRTRSLGGYVAGAVSQNWMLDGTLIYSQSDNTQNLLMLSGHYDASNWATTLGASGQYLVDKTLLRPRVALNYSHYNADSYTLRGNYAGLALQLPFRKQSSNYGAVVLSTEISRVYFTEGGMPVIPYVEPSIEVAFTRPNDGRMMAGDLSQVRTSAVSGALRAGVRFLVTRNSNLTAAAGYTSLGQNGLNVREFRVYFSHAF